MIRYLSSVQLQANLSMGLAIEQWLGHQLEQDFVFLKWISIYKENDGNYTVLYIENFDDGNEDYLDIYSFSYVDPDEPAVSSSFNSIEQALEFAKNTYGASFEKYVARGLIQDEYLNYRLIVLLQHLRN